MEKALIRSTQNRIHPHKFALWLVFAAVIMMFTGFTSAYVVRQAQGNFLEFKIPNLFFYNTATLILSSILLHGSYEAFKRGFELRYKWLMVGAFVTGIVFIILQYLGWVELSKGGVTITGNPAGSFFYLIPFVHLLHVLGGLVVLVIALVHAFYLKYKVTERRKIRFQLTLQYWHFVDILWIYLMVFFVAMNS